MQDPAPEEGLRWSALDWEAQAGPGCPSVRRRSKGRDAEGTERKLGSEAKGPES